MTLRPMRTWRAIESALLLALVLAALAVTACVTGHTYARGERAAQAGDWDMAVAYFTRAVQESPGDTEYKVALQRAMENAAVNHLDKGRVAEAKGQLDEALREYRKAADYNPLNGELVARIQAIEQKIRDRNEALRPKPRIEQLREQARQTPVEPQLNPASRQPLDIKFNNASVKAILDFIGQWTGINVTFERDAARPAEQAQYTVELHGVTLEQGLYQILTANGFFYKVMDPHTIMVIQDNPTKRMQYEEQAIQTFFVSHVDANDLMTIVNSVMRLPGMTNPPTFSVNKATNTITARASAPVLKIIEQVVQSNDKPRAELLFDVEILEVNRNRVAQYGLDLNDYSISAVLWPEGTPGGTTSSSSTTGTSTGTTSGTGTTTTTSSGVTSVAHTDLFPLSSWKNGFTNSQTFLSIPGATLRALETDSDTRIVAKPQLRGSEGEKLSLNLGSQYPVPTTTFAPLGAGGVNSVPISSFTLKDIGLNFTITPRVTFEGDIILTLELENSTFAGNVSLAGQDLPTFGQRKVSTRLRLRDGEPNLLAGLLQTTDTTSVKGFPGILRLPIFKQLFSSNNNNFVQSDIIMLLTPHIIRSHELTQADVSPIYIGTAQNMGLSGPPPLIAAPPAAGGQATTPAQGVAPGTPPAAAVIGMPPAGQAPGVVPPVPLPNAPVTGNAGLPPGASGAPSPTTPASAQPGLPPGAAAVAPGATPPPAAAAAETGMQPAAKAALVAVTASSPDFRVGGGPYTIPVTINDAVGVSTMTLTLRFNPAVLKVRGVQEGSFMKQGGLNSGFAQQVDAANGRVDITFTRAGDSAGASGGGLLAAVLFDAVAPGSATLAVSGAAAGPGGNTMALQFAPATVTVK